MQQRSIRPGPFFQSGPAADPLYRKVRDCSPPWMVEAKAFVEELWTEAWPYVDADLPAQARVGFFSRYWELYLTVALLRWSVPLVARASRGATTRGPDLLAAFSPRVFLEAVAVTPGKGPDAVPEVVSGKAQDVPHNEVILRIRSGIKEKHEKLAAYETQGILLPTDAFVIALNAGQIYPAKLPPVLPHEVMAVLPFGDAVAQVDLTTNTWSDGGFTYRRLIQKRFGAPVSTDIFDCPSYSGISALLYSRIDLLNRPEKIGQGPIGADFSIVHNPFARIPLPHGLFPCWREYWVDENRRLCHVQPAPSRKG
jgi:hypothetical protein